MSQSPSGSPFARTEVRADGLAVVTIGGRWTLDDALPVVVVRGDYFQRFWGDEFKFGATWLNGYELDFAGHNPKTKIEKFNNGGPVYNLKLLADAKRNGREWAGEVLRRIEDQIRRLPDNPNMGNIREFKDEWRETRKIDLRLLNKAIENGRTGLVKRVRDEIVRLIDTLPEE